MATCDSIVPLQYSDYGAAYLESYEATGNEDCFRDVTAQLSYIFSWGIPWAISLAFFWFSAGCLYLMLGFGVD